LSSSGSRIRHHCYPSLTKLNSFKVILKEIHNRENNLLCTRSRVAPLPQVDQEQMGYICPLLSSSDFIQTFTQSFLEIHAHIDIRHLGKHIERRTDNITNQRVTENVNLCSPHSKIIPRPFSRYNFGDSTKGYRNGARSNMNRKEESKAQH